MKLPLLVLAGTLVGLFPRGVKAADMFVRVTTGPGAIPNGSSAVAWGDFNNDGWLDLFVTSFGGTQNNYCYTNRGDGTFVRILPTFFPANNINSFGCAWADYDNDGYLDLVKGISNPFGGSTQLYRNGGNGTFSNVTGSSLGNVGPGANNVIWGDYDNDGYVDLFQAVGYNAPDNVLLHNRGDGTFSRVTGNPMVTATGLSAGASWGDYDNDGRLDLLVTRTSAGCLFYHNEGGGLFRQITNQPFSTDANGGGVSWGDYDNDGYLDVFIAHPQAPNRLYHNNGDGSFTEATNQIIYQTRGTSSAGIWADYDNDGWLDLFVANSGGNGSFLYHNDGQGGFTRITNEVVATDVGTGQGAAWGDYDNNGFPDLLVPNIFTYNNFLYRNNGNANAWLSVKLEGRLSNRAAIGAKVRVRATIQGDTVWQLRELSGGGGLGGQNDLRAGFGLGDATNVDLVRIEWPSGIVQELHDVMPRQFLTVIESGVSGPVIVTQQPHSIMVRPGSNALFSVTVSGLPPFTYQWRREGIALPDETNAMLTIPNAQLERAGRYDVVVANDYGPITSKPATLGFLVDPVIVAQPLSQAMVIGGSVTLSVAVTGEPAPFTFEWRRGSIGLRTEVTSQSMSFLTLSNLLPSHAGIYRVVIKNAANAQPGILSSNAVLTVLADADGDGLPDEWETAYGLKPADANDATLDSDGDGMSNRQEYLAGTDPADPRNFLHIESIHCDNTPAWRLQFFAASNRTYSVQAADVLQPDATWRSVGELPAMPTNRTVEVIRPVVGVSPKFFRLATPRTP